LAAAGGAAAVALALLLGRWCASPFDGAGLALVAAALGVLAGARRGPLDPAAARVRAAAGALAALAIPALLRVVGLSLASPLQLAHPLAGAGQAVLALGQAGALAAAAAFAWTRALRGRAGLPAAAAALAGAGAAWTAGRAGPAEALAVAALVALSGAALAERPWASWEARAFRARLFAAAPAAGLLLAAAAPGLMRDVWMARLHAAYPGGEYLTRGADGARVWASYRFSNGDGALLRDGVLQLTDPASAWAAAVAVLGQRPATASLLISGEPASLAADAALTLGAAADFVRGTPAAAAAADRLSAPDWRKSVPAPAAGAPLGAALALVPAPLDPFERRAAVGPAALATLRRRLRDGAAAAVLLPPNASPATVDAVLAASARVFGRSRAADLPRGTLVIASPDPVVTDPGTLFSRMPLTARLSRPDGARDLAAALHWRPLPSAK
jgi:hypothetical protein